jgi:integrase
MAKRRIDRVSFRKKHGALYARFQVQERTEEGEIVWRSRERSTRTLSEHQARKCVDLWKKEALDSLFKPIEKKAPTEVLFAHAVIKYSKEIGKNKGYLKRILKAQVELKNDDGESSLMEFGRISLDDIDSDLVAQLADVIHAGKPAATKNRNVYTPVIAVLSCAETKTWKPPTIERPAGYLPDSNFKRPPRDWYARVLPECKPNLAAFLIFGRIHGRRTSEACKIKPDDIDADWRVTVFDPKGKQLIRFKLAAPVIDALERYPWRLNQYVFGFSSKSKVYPELREVCNRAGVPYHVPKDARAPCHGNWPPGRRPDSEGGEGGRPLENNEGGRDIYPP